MPDRVLHDCTVYEFLDDTDLSARWAPVPVLLSRHRPFCTVRPVQVCVSIRASKDSSHGLYVPDFLPVARGSNTPNRIGIAAMCVTPLSGRLVVDRLTPLWSVIFGATFAMVGTCIGTYTGLFTVAGPVVQAFMIDLGLQTSQIANRAAIYSIAPKARNRVNTAFMVFTFCGQLTGTAVGNRLYARGGWVQSGSYSVASLGAALLVCLLKGPYEQGWVGWTGGWRMVRPKSLGTASPPGEAAPSESEDHGSDDGHGSARLSVNQSTPNSSSKA